MPRSCHHVDDIHHQIRQNHISVARHVQESSPGFTSNDDLHCTVRQHRHVEHVYRHLLIRITIGRTATYLAAHNGCTGICLCDICADILVILWER